MVLSDLHRRKKGTINGTYSDANINRYFRRGNFITTFMAKSK